MDLAMFDRAVRLDHVAASIASPLSRQTIVRRIVEIPCPIGAVFTPITSTCYPEYALLQLLDRKQVVRLGEKIELYVD